MNKVREALEDAIQNLGHLPLGDVGHAMHNIRDALAALDGEWVKCSERLPDDDRCVIFSDSMQNQWIGVEPTEAPFGEGSAIYWRELPAPPED